MNSENKHFCLERQREKDNFMDAENKDICQKDEERKTSFWMLKTKAFV